jgi:hypothetical protein
MRARSPAPASFIAKPPRDIVEECRTRGIVTIGRRW